MDKEGVEITISIRKIEPDDQAWVQAFLMAQAGAMAQSRKLKPEIPLIGLNGIPIEDEIEFEQHL